MANHGLLTWCFHQDKKDKDDKEKVLEEEVEPASVLRIIKMNLSEWPYLSIGSIAGAINGLFPFAFALVLSEILAVSDTIYFTFIRNATSCYCAIVRQSYKC